MSDHYDSQPGGYPDKVPVRIAELARLRRIVAALSPAFVAWVEGQARVTRAGQQAAVNLAARRNGVEAEQMSRSARELGGHGDMLDAFLAAIAMESEE